MTTNSSWELPKLSDEQKTWLIDARAIGMTYEEIPTHFREKYPTYADEIPDDVFPGLFKTRIKKMLNTSINAAKQLVDAKKVGELPVDPGVIPLVDDVVRLLAFQRLWDETPPQTLVRVIETEDGEERLYKSNTRERLAILAEVRKELQILGILSSKPAEPEPSANQRPEEVPKVVMGGNLWDKRNAN